MREPETFDELALGIRELNYSQMMKLAGLLSVFAAARGIVAETDRWAVVLSEWADEYVEREPGP